MEFLRKVTMKTHGHYKTLSAIKQQTEIVDILVKRREAKSSKVRQWNIRDMKREYRLSRPKKTRYNYEIKRSL